MTLNNQARLEAIIARIEGVWDNPALLEFGPLSTDTLADVMYIARSFRTRRKTQKVRQARAGKEKL